MKLPEQQKGRAHLRYINERASAILQNKFDFKGGNWHECIRMALKEHREYLVRCCEERNKIEAEKTPRCDGCGTLLEPDDIFHYVSYCHDCFQREYIDRAVNDKPKGRPPGCYCPVANQVPSRRLCL
jgi:hypothetical protein